ncbi:efflux transporter outer membrane subunit [Noviherbaspirillum denitrificans]|uniref:SPOR domain-containing protein n=1 Tax=Noviherbaspirillum denitrificans TaxID=1968433 RepID=A0A254TAP6_9BURK|nr:efflux transporter outer membrane subunit [Noviherbaspirillum denitrificans]OWW19704.1 hypothetical protein AYR66_09530 [Noviherbaspirillum denitrificans]
MRQTIFSRRALAGQFKPNTLHTILSIALAGITLAGCAVKRDRYDVPAVPIPATFPKAATLPLPAMAAPARSGSAPDAGTPAGNAVALDQALPQWWRLLGSTELNRLVDRALSGNQDLRIANLRIAQATARAKQAVSDQLPVITAPLQARREAPAGGIATVPAGGEVKSRDVYQIGLRGDWRVDVWGERAALAESTDLQLWRTVFQRDEVRRTLIANVVTGYIDYLSFNDRMEVARETDKAVSDMLESIAARLEKGDATVIDMEQQRAAVYSVKATIPALQQQRDEALNNLSFLLGAPPGSLKLTGKGLGSLSYPAVVPDVPSSLLLRRPDIRVMEARLLAADADLDVARARLLPPLDVTAQAGFGSLFVSQMFESHTLFWNVIANLSATIFDYGKRNREIDFAKALHEELVETYVRVIYSGIREVDDALNAIQLTRLRLDAQREAAEAARRSWEYSRESYQAGSVDHLLMLDAERTYHRNLDEQHNIDMLRYRALVSLFSALGGGLQAEGPLPGKGERPTASADAYPGFAVVLQPDSAPSRTQDGLGLSVSLGSTPESGTWLLELGSVADKLALATMWRDLKMRLPELMEQRILLPRKSGEAEKSGGGQEMPYQVFLAHFASSAEADAACSLLRQSQYRCKVVASGSIPTAANGAPSAPADEPYALRIAPELGLPAGGITAAARTVYAVEIGRSGSRQEAAALAESWKDKGYNAYVTPMTEDDGLPGFAVRFGQLQSEDQAVMLAQAFTEREGKPARSVRQSLSFAQGADGGLGQ